MGDSLPPATTPRWNRSSRFCRNVLNRDRSRTRGELRYATVQWNEHTYNRRRRQRGLGRHTPVEYQLAFTQPAAAHAA